MAESLKPDWLAQMEGILETLNEGVMIVDDCNQIIFSNQCLIEMAGYPIEEALNRGPGYFFQGEDLERATKLLAGTQHDGRTRFEFFVPRKDGTKIPAIISSRIIEDLEGRQFTVITFTDITEQKRAQAEVEQANGKLRERQEEIERELQLAQRVQRSLAPQCIRWGPFAVEAFYMPVSSIGGDFGLVTPLGDDALNLLVCDVTGHGISAALIANRIYTETMHLLEHRADPGEILRRLNDFVYRNIQVSGFYFTLAVARLHDHKRRLTFASAGHPPALWIAPGGEARRLESRSMVLGLLEQAVHADPVEEVELSPGDRLVLYTDGFTEVNDHRGEQLGVDGLEEIARQSATLPLVEMKQRILDRVGAWRHGPYTDDMSLVLVEVQ
jgi:sigma-B regulation protein RsbU (phosphoserine phosphatase)